MGVSPHDKELIDGTTTRRHVEDRPSDTKQRSLQRQEAPQPDWGRSMEEQLRAKRGPTGGSKHPGFPRGGR